MRPFCLLLAALPLTAEVLVLHKGDSSLGFYSDAGKLIAKAPVNKHPHEMVLSADRKLVYTTDNGTMRIEQAGEGGNTISIIDIAGRKKIGEVSTGEFRRPHGIARIAATGQLLVSTELPDRLLLIDPEARKVVKTYDTKGKTAHMVVGSPDGKWAWVSNSTSANVSAINLETGEVKLIPTGQRPEGSVLSHSGKTLYVGNRDSGGISVIDTAANTVTKTWPTPKGPVRIDITPDDRYVVYGLLDEKAVAWIDTKTGKQAGRVELPADLGQIVSLHLSPDGKTAWASNQNLDRVYAVDLEAKKIRSEWTLTKDFGPDPAFPLGQ